MSKILFIGAGNMGQAIINGVISKDKFNKKDIAIYEVDDKTRLKVIANWDVNTISSIDEQIKEFDYIILAVKPQIFKNFGNDDKMKNLKNFITKKQTIVSIMAGITIKKLEDFFGENTDIVRVMPNTPALVGLAASVLSPSSSVSKEKLNCIKEIFESIGIVEIIEEKHIDAVTGLSGSGPAYVFMFIESLIQGGILCGLSKEISEKLAIQTVLGSAMMASKDKNVENLRHMVTSPGGTTIEAISILESMAFRSSLIEAVRGATEKSKELGKNN